MADKKISALTSAATPLAGTEVLPIVQSGSTVKVSIANVTAGRNIAANTLIMDLGTSGPAYVQAKNTSVDSYFAVANYSLWATGYNDSPSLQIGTATNHPIVIGVNNVGVARFGANDLSLFNGNVVIGTAGKGVQGTGGLSNSTYATVGAGGFLDLPISASGFVGTLSVSTTRTNFTPQSRRAVYGVACYGTTLTTTQLHIQDGTGGGSTFSLSVVGGAIRVTDTAGVAPVDIYIAFSGAFSYGS
jgi:hypothetical protein